MKAAISQPAYLPWLGYFDLIDQVDSFVLLDSVQFEKQSWQQRNRIKTPTGLQWLTVPVIFNGRFGQHIRDVEIRETDFWRKHLRAIELNYRRTKHFGRYYPELSDLFSQMGGSLLVELNSQIIQWFRRIFGMQTKISYSSNMNEPGRRSELLVNLCRSLDASFYLSPLGSSVYLCEDLQLFSDAGIEVGFQHYEHPEYRQLFPPFVPYASALDLLFNEGTEAMAIIRSGRRPAFAPSELPEATVGKKD
jgi:hypothetical protein